MVITCTNQLLRAKYRLCSAHRENPHTIQKRAPRCACEIPQNYTSAAPETKFLTTGKRFASTGQIPPNYTNTSPPTSPPQTKFSHKRKMIDVERSVLMRAPSRLRASLVA